MGGIKLKFAFSGFRGTETEKTGQNTDKALVIFRTLSVRPFSYPFASVNKVREAISMELRTILGEGISSFAAIPLFLSKGKNSSSGNAFIVSENELINAEQELPKGISVLPSPLAFIGEIEGNGLVVCVKGVKDGLSGILFKNGSAVVCRWMSEGTHPLTMVSWFEEYALSAGIDIPKTEIKYLDSMTEDDVRTSLSESEAQYPWLKNFTMSISAAESATRKDLLAASVSKMLEYFMVLGILFSLCSGILFIQNIVGNKVFSDLPAAVYIKAFGEPSTNPLSSAIKKSRNVRDPESTLTFERLVGDISAVLRDGSVKSGIVLDNLRYGRERSEIQGTAEDAKGAEQLRAALETMGFTARITDIRQIPAAGMRFSISLERGE